MNVGPLVQLFWLTDPDAVAIRLVDGEPPRLAVQSSPSISTEFDCFNEDEGDDA